jgi:hypothetical protein
MLPSTAGHGATKPGLPPSNKLVLESMGPQAQLHLHEGFGAPPGLPTSTEPQPLPSPTLGMVARGDSTGPLLQVLANCDAQVLSGVLQDLVEDSTISSTRLREMVAKQHQGRLEEGHAHGKLRFAKRQKGLLRVVLASPLSAFALCSAVSAF